MKILLINGSPNINGATKRALSEIEKILKECSDISFETIDLSSKNIRGCIACRKCSELKRCVFEDIVNEVAKKFEESDALIIGTPVYYAGINGTLKSFLDRLFFSTKFSKLMKIGASVVSSRRAGSTNAFDEINKYFSISGMVIATSTYWNEVHGSNKEEVEKDLEGLETMRNLARNVVFLVNAIRKEKEKLGLPKNEKDVFTSFIR